MVIPKFPFISGIGRIWDCELAYINILEIYESNFDCNLRGSEEEPWVVLWTVMKDWTKEFHN